ncbi:MAG: insulinase family protein, partial [Ginsengibacter sp.]
MPNRTITPPIKDAIDFKITLPPYTKFNLSNGAPVYYINDGAEEVAVVDFVFDAGNVFENKN